MKDERICLITNDVETTSILNHKLRDKTGEYVLKQGMPRLFDLYDKYGASADTTTYLHSFRRILMKDAICHVHPLLVLYFLTLFPPIRLFLKCRLFRRCHYLLNRIINKLS